ncbi:MAG: NADase-type glycan-binding domain-containing protein [Flavobacterium sp.]|jgi:hypothetical protein|uniref:NADase-type glycan-binding domain-containing protein n=1 Tax=Flavobacterium sp. TaxID=239 RepID=UPI003BA4C6FC
MNKLLCSIFSLISTFIHCQKLREYKPKEIREIKTNFTEDFVQKYNSKESLEICKAIWDKMSKENLNFDDLTDLEKDNLNYCDEFEGNPWSKKFTGCSWYCGGIIDSIYSTATSNTNNIHDSDYGTVWKSNDNIKVNYIEYIFKAESARVSEIIIVNGYVKTNELFQEFSRVKKIKMYVNDKPYAILNLNDIKDEQVFVFKPIGHKKNKNYEPVNKNDWKIKFEIIEIYNGKVDIISLSEIYFDGDGHE